MQRPTSSESKSARGGGGLGEVVNNDINNSNNVDENGGPSILPPVTTPSRPNSAKSNKSISIHTPRSSADMFAPPMASWRPPSASSQNSSSERMEPLAAPRGKRNPISLGGMNLLVGGGGENGSSSVDDGLTGRTSATGDDWAEWIAIAKAASAAASGGGRAKSREDERSAHNTKQHHQRRSTSTTTRRKKDRDDISDDDDESGNESGQHQRRKMLSLPSVKKDRKNNNNSAWSGGEESGETRISQLKKKQHKKKSKKLTDLEEMSNRSGSSAGGGGAAPWIPGATLSAATANSIVWAGTGPWNATGLGGDSIRRPGSAFAAARIASGFDSSNIGLGNRFEQQQQVRRQSQASEGEILTRPSTSGGGDSDYSSSVFVNPISVETAGQSFGYGGGVIAAANARRASASVPSSPVLVGGQKSDDVHGGGGSSSSYVANSNMSNNNNSPLVESLSVSALVNRLKALSNNNSGDQSSFMLSSAHSSPSLRGGAAAPLPGRKDMLAPLKLSEQKKITTIDYKQQLEFEARKIMGTNSPAKNHPSMSDPHQQHVRQLLDDFSSSVVFAPGASSTEEFNRVEKEKARLRAVYSESPGFKKNRLYELEQERLEKAKPPQKAPIIWRFDEDDGDFHSNIKPNNAEKLESTNNEGEDSAYDGGGDDDENTQGTNSADRRKKLEDDEIFRLPFRSTGNKAFDRLVLQARERTVLPGENTFQDRIKNAKIKAQEEEIQRKKDEEEAAAAGAAGAEGTAAPETDTTAPRPPSRTISTREREERYESILQMVLSSDVLQQQNERVVATAVDLLKSFRSRPAWEPAFRAEGHRVFDALTAIAAALPTEAMQSEDAQEHLLDAEFRNRIRQMAVDHQQREIDEWRHRMRIVYGPRASTPSPYLPATIDPFQGMEQQQQNEASPPTPLEMYMRSQRAPSPPYESDGAKSRKSFMFSSSDDADGEDSASGAPRRRVGGAYPRPPWTTASGIPSREGRSDVELGDHYRARRNMPYPPPLAGRPSGPLGIRPLSRSQPLRAFIEEGDGDQHSRSSSPEKLLDIAVSPTMAMMLRGRRSDSPSDVEIIDKVERRGRRRRVVFPHWMDHQQQEKMQKWYDRRIGSREKRPVSVFELPSSTSLEKDSILGHPSVSTQLANSPLAWTTTSLGGGGDPNNKNIGSTTTNALNEPMPLRRPQLRPLENPPDGALPKTAGGSLDPYPMGASALLQATTTGTWVGSEEAFGELRQNGNLGRFGRGRGRISPTKTTTTSTKLPSLLPPPRGSTMSAGGTKRPISGSKSRPASALQFGGEDELGDGENDDDDDSNKVDIRDERRHFGNEEVLIQRVLDRRGGGGGGAGGSNQDLEDEEAILVGAAQEDAFVKALEVVPLFGVSVASTSKSGEVKVQRMIAKLKAAGEKAWVRVTSNMHQVERAKVRAAQAQSGPAARAQLAVADRLSMEADAIATKILRQVAMDGGSLEHLPPGFVRWLQRRNEMIAAKRGSKVSTKMAAILNPIVQEVCDINAAIVLAELQLQIAKKLKRTAHRIKARNAIMAAEDELRMINSRADAFRKKTRRQHSLRRELLPEYVRNFLDSDESAQKLWDTGATDPDVCVLAADVRMMNVRIRNAMRALARSFGPNKLAQRNRALQELEAAEKEVVCFRKEVEGYDISKLPRFARNFFQMSNSRAHRLLAQGYTDERVCKVYDKCEDILNRVKRIRGRPAHGTIVAETTLEWTEEQALIDGYEEDLLKVRGEFSKLPAERTACLPSWIMAMLKPAPSFASASVTELWESGKIDPDVCEMSDAVQLINEGFDRARAAEKRHAQMVAAGHVVTEDDYEHGVAKTVDEQAAGASELCKWLRTRYRTLGIPSERFPPHVRNVLETTHLSPRTLWKEGLSDSLIVEVKGAVDEIVTLIESVELLPKHPGEDEETYGEQVRRVQAITTEERQLAYSQAEKKLTALRNKFRGAVFSENMPDHLQILLTSSDSGVNLWQLGIFGSRTDLVRERNQHQLELVKESRRLYEELERQRKEEAERLEAELEAKKKAEEEALKALYDSSEEDEEEEEERGKRKKKKTNKRIGDDDEEEEESEEEEEEEEEDDDSDDLDDGWEISLWNGAWLDDGNDDDDEEEEDESDDDGDEAEDTDNTNPAGSNDDASKKQKKKPPPRVRIAGETKRSTLQLMRKGPRAADLTRSGVHEISRQAAKNGFPIGLELAKYIHADVDQMSVVTNASSVTSREFMEEEEDLSSLSSSSSEDAVGVVVPRASRTKHIASLELLVENQMKGAEIREAKRMWKGLDRVVGISPALYSSAWERKGRGRGRRGYDPDSFGNVVSGLPPRPFSAPPLHRYRQYQTSASSSLSPKALAIENVPSRALRAALVTRGEATTTSTSPDDFSRPVINLPERQMMLRAQDAFFSTTSPLYGDGTNFGDDRSISGTGDGSVSSRRGRYADVVSGLDESRPQSAPPVLERVRDHHHRHGRSPSPSKKKTTATTKKKKKKESKTDDDGSSSPVSSSESSTANLPKKKKSKKKKSKNSKSDSGAKKKKKTKKSKKGKKSETEGDDDDDGQTKEEDSEESSSSSDDGEDKEGAANLLHLLQQHIATSMTPMPAMLKKLYRRLRHPDTYQQRREERRRRKEEQRMERRTAKMMALAMATRPPGTASTAASSTITTTTTTTTAAAAAAQQKKKKETRFADQDGGELEKRSALGDDDDDDEERDLGDDAKSRASAGSEGNNSNGSEAGVKKKNDDDDDDDALAVAMAEAENDLQNGADEELKAEPSLVKMMKSREKLISILKKEEQDAAAKQSGNAGEVNREGLTTANTYDSSIGDAALTTTDPRKKGGRAGPGGFRSNNVKLMGRANVSVTMEQRILVDGRVQDAKRQGTQLNRTLDVSYLRLPILTRSIMDEIATVHFFANNNLLVTIPPQIAEWHKLKTVVLSYNELEELPQELYSCARVITLFLDHNKLIGFNPPQGGFPFIRQVNLSNNKFIWGKPEMKSSVQRAHPALGNMYNLRSLRIDSTNCGGLTRPFINLTHLENISMCRNQFTHFPTQLCELSLHRVLIAHNQLQELHKKVERMTRLTHLDISHNHFTEFPGVLFKLPRLKILCLDSNRMKQIPKLDKMRALTHLSVARNSLSMLPESIFALKRLSALRLACNKLEMLPPTLSNLRQLTALDVSYNNIANIDAEVGRLPLISLEISGNPLQTPPYGHAVTRGVEWILSYLRRMDKSKTSGELDFSGLSLSAWAFPFGLERSSLTTLHLQNNCIGGLRDVEMMGFTNLKELRLDGNSLQRLPFEIGDCTALTLLDLSDNRIQEVTKEMLGNLTNLTILNLDRNAIKTLPVELGACTSITHLGLTRCKLSLPPPEITEMGSASVMSFLLKHLNVREMRDDVLDLAGLGLVIVPAVTMRSPLVHTLLLSKNKLRKIPTELPSRLLHLTTLELQCNYFTEIPHELCLCTALTAFNASMNILTSVPSGLEVLTMLEKLDLSMNTITEIPSWLGTLTKLRELHLHSNCLVTLPPDMAHLTLLKTLTARQNVLRDPLATLVLEDSPVSVLRFLNALLRARETHCLDFEKHAYRVVAPEICDMTTITDLNLSFNGLEMMPRTGGQLVLLKRLNLSDNDLVSLPYQCASWVSLEILDMSRNARMFCVPHCLRAMTSLRELLLTDCALDVFPEFFGELQRLEKIRYTNNHIRLLPTSVGNLTNLTELDVARNKMEELCVEIQHLTNLKMLSIEHNFLTLLPFEIASLVQLSGCNILFEGNDFSNPPPVICRRGLASMVDFLHRLANARGDNDGIVEDGDMKGTLDLTGLELGIVPRAVHMLDDLRSLILDSNNLSWLPPSLRLLTRLRELSVCNNKLTMLPRFIGWLTNLRELHFEGNNISDPSPVLLKRDTQWLLGYLRRLDAAGWTRSLDLAREELLEIPPEVVVLPGLTSLRVSSNQLTDLPMNFSRLSSLRALYLHDNKLTGLPPSVASLEHIRILHLQDNRLKSLPSELCTCTTLSDLRIQCNDLKSLPNEMGQLILVDDLRMYTNVLTCLPTGLENLHFLTSLRLSYNRITALPRGIGKFHMLTEILLISNLLEELPAEVSEISSLTRLHLSDNKLKSIPAELGNLPHLVEMTLADNELERVPCELCLATTLQELALENNCLVSPPVYLCARGTQEIMRYLRRLYLGRGAPEEVVARGELTVDHFHLALKQAETTSVLLLRCLSLFSFPPQLMDAPHIRNIDLSVNNILEMPHSLHSLSKLESLRLDYNEIAHLPRTINEMVSLHSLFLNYNCFTEFPETLTTLSALRVLSLDNNRLQILPASLSRMESLSSLSVCNNQLRVLQHGCTYLSKLEELRLSQNHIRDAPPHLGVTCPSLAVLHLDFNDVAVIPQTLPLLSGLKELHLSYNQLLRGEIVDPLMGDLPSLPLTTLVTLEELTLTNNHLPIIPPSWHVLTRLRLLHIGNNPARVEPQNKVLESHASVQKYLKYVKATWDVERDYQETRRRLMLQSSAGHRMKTHPSRSRTLKLGEN